MVTVAPLDENAKQKATRLGWEIKTSGSAKNPNGKNAQYYYCPTLKEGGTSQYETPQVQCPETPKTTCPTLPPTTYTVNKTNNGTFEVIPQAGGKRKQRKRYGKKTRKLRNQKKKQ
jgi:hypothetical protein